MYAWTSEAVAAGHPDKVADQIADAILDAHLDQDSEARVACEVVVTRDGSSSWPRDLVILTGEITSNGEVDYEGVVRSVLYDIGYDRPEHGCCHKTVVIENHIRAQSPEIAAAVVRDDGEIGAGDQGLMFGYACRETQNLMPLAHSVAFSMIDLIQKDIQSKRNGDEWGSIFLPDAKTQATVIYNEYDQPIKVDSLVVSVCYKEGVSLDEVRSQIMQLVPNVIGYKYFLKDTKYILNPSGEWNFGGPAADTGLSGRKIVVDNYGADCPIGGGSFSGKDPTKVDRSAAYAARQLAKAFVAGGFADKARVQLSYAIGVVDPVSIRVQTFGTGEGEPWMDYEQKLTKMAEKVGLSPSAIIKRLDLREPFGFGGYLNTAAGGHFGRPEFPWEQTEELIKEFKT